MKKIILLFCIFLVFGLLPAQEKQINYSRVKIYATEQEHFDALMGRGVCLENLDVRKGVYIIGEFSDVELEKIQETQIPYEVLINNMSKHYEKQNKAKSVKKINRELKKKAKKKREDSRTPVNFHLGSMGGYFTLNEIMLPK
jgi:hypothetical protein